MRLATAIAAGDLEAAHRHGAAATELATKEGRPHLAAVVHMMFASALIVQQRPDEALSAYAQAERLAEVREAQESDDRSSQQSEQTVGRKLRLHARLGQGAVLLTTRMFKRAAESYTQTAPIAQSLEDQRTELDCYRLAAVAYAADGDAALGWQLGLRGMQVGLAMDEETRKSSTLLYLADHLLRMAKAHEQYSAHRRPLEAQLGKLFGSDWQKQLVALGAV